MPHQLQIDSCQNLILRKSVQHTLTGRVEPRTSSGNRTDRHAQEIYSRNTNMPSIQATYGKQVEIQGRYVMDTDEQDEYANDADSFMKAMNEAIAKTVALPLDCPYHAPTLQLRTVRNGLSSGHDPMSRFLAEGGLEQPPSYFWTETGSQSVNKNCTCGRLVEQVAAAEQPNDQRVTVQHLARSITCTM